MNNTTTYEWLHEDNMLTLDETQANLTYRSKDGKFTVLKKQGIKNVFVTHRSMFNPYGTTMQLPMGICSFLLAYTEWQTGMLIQKAFDKLNADQREFLMTGASPEQWNNLFLPENKVISNIQSLEGDKENEPEMDSTEDYQQYLTGKVISNIQSFEGEQLP